MKRRKTLTGKDTTPLTTPLMGDPRMTPRMQILRGYFLKNEAMALRNLGDHEQFQTKLMEAEQFFRTVLGENKSLFASTLNGIGSVEMLRGQFKEALNWIDMALEIEPDHEAAKQDRQTVMHYLSITAE